MFSLVAYDDSEDEDGNNDKTAGEQDQENEDSSSAEEDASDNDGSRKVTGQEQSRPALPSASLMLADSKKIIPGGVFNNPFREAETERLARMEKHVKMVDPDHKTGDQKRKVCWSYRKGRCRFGSKCSFAHDSDLILKKELHGEENPDDTAEDVMAGSSIESGNGHKKGINQNKKKRPGLARELVPPKKVLKMYHRDKFSSKS